MNPILYVFKRLIYTLGNQQQTTSQSNNYHRLMHTSYCDFQDSQCMTKSGLIYLHSAVILCLNTLFTRLQTESINSLNGLPGY